MIVEKQTNVLYWFVSINWSSQTVANISALIAAMGTLSAVIVALKQSREAKIEAERNRLHSIELNQEKIRTHNSLCISPPEIIPTSIGITVTNEGQVSVYLQNICWCKENISTSLVVTNEHITSYSVRFPVSIPPGVRITYYIEFKYLLHLAKYAFQMCESDPSKIKLVVSTNLNTFYSPLNENIVEKVNQLIEVKKDSFERQIIESREAQDRYEQGIDEGAWLKKFKNT